MDFFQNLLWKITKITTTTKKLKVGSLCDFIKRKLLDIDVNFDYIYYFFFRVYVVNARYGLAEMQRIYKGIANKFWHLLPKELKNRQCWLY